MSTHIDELEEQNESFAKQLAEAKQEIRVITGGAAENLRRVESEATAKAAGVEARLAAVCAERDSLQREVSEARVANSGTKAAPAVDYSSRYSEAKQKLLDVTARVAELEGELAATAKTEDILRAEAAAQAKEAAERLAAEYEARQMFEESIKREAAAAAADAEVSHGVTKGLLATLRTRVEEEVSNNIDLANELASTIAELGELGGVTAELDQKTEELEVAKHETDILIERTGALEAKIEIQAEEISSLKATEAMKKLVDQQPATAEVCSI